MKKGDRVLLTKISDDRFNGNHPNNIYKGFSAIGELVYDVEIGIPVVMDKIRGNVTWFHTSVIEEIKDDIIKTRNSTYKIEVIGESKS